MIDGTVVVGAIARADLVVTSNPDDIARIADGLNTRLDILTV